MTIRQALAFAHNPDEMSIAEDFLKRLDAFCEKARAAGWEVDVDEDFNDEDGDYTQIMMKYTDPDSNQSAEIWVFPRNTAEDLCERVKHEIESYTGWLDHNVAENQLKTGRPIMDIYKEYSVLKEKVNELSTLLD